MNPNSLGEILPVSNSSGPIVGRGKHGFQTELPCIYSMYSSQVTCWSLFTLINPWCHCIALPSKCKAAIFTQLSLGPPSTSKKYSTLQSQFSNFSPLNLGNSNLAECPHECLFSEPWPETSSSVSNSLYSAYGEFRTVPHWVHQWVLWFLQWTPLKNVAVEVRLPVPSELLRF